MKRSLWENNGVFIAVAMEFLRNLLCRSECLGKVKERFVVLLLFLKVGVSCVFIPFYVSG